MGIGVPFIFQIVLLLALPLVFVYLISVAGLLFVSIGALLKKQARRPRSGQSVSLVVPE